MDDLRNHDAKPTTHEREWIETDPRRAISRLFICGALAVMTGAASSTLLNNHPHRVSVAATSR